MSKKTCPTCHGSGEIIEMESYLILGFIVPSTCTTCDGTGEIETENEA